MLEAVEPLFQRSSHPNFLVCRCKPFHASLARPTPTVVTWCQSSVQSCSCSALRQSQRYISCCLPCRYRGTGQQHFHKRHLIGRPCLLRRLAAVRKALSTSLKLLAGRLMRSHIVPLRATKRLLPSHRCAWRSPQVVRLNQL